MTDLAFNLIMDCGQAMLANGGEVFRAQDTMEIMARSFGIVDFHVYVLTNGIFASAQNGTVSAVRHVPVVSTNLGHVEAINAISRRVADGELDLNSAQLEFERMKRMPTLSPLYNCAAGTMGAGCFAMLFGGLYLYNRLDEPPSYPDSYRQENGQMIQQPGGVNPNYLQGKQRVVYEILYDLLPDGQGMQILSGEVASPQALGRNAGASLLLMGLTTALGLGEFRRKDLR